MKKVLSLVLAICLVAGAVIAAPVTGFAAASGQCGDNLTWTLDDDGTLTISGTGDMWDWMWYGSPWYENSDIKKVEIQKGVTSIGSCAFQSCESLESITIPDGVTNITGSWIFRGCSALSSISIPNSMTSIGGDVFCDCSGIENVYYDGTWSEWNNLSIGNNNEYFILATIHCKGEPDILKSGQCGDNLTWTFDNAKTLTISGTGAITNRSWIEYQSDIKSVIISDGVTNIIGYAFEECKNLISVDIPNTVTRIGEQAFHRCKWLTRVTIPGSVTEIARETFWGCEQLTNVNIPDSVENIGDYAFSGCERLTNINIPDSVKSIGYYAFDECDKLSTVSIGKGVTSIGVGSFYGCDRLTEINVSDANPNYRSIDGNLYNKDMTALIQYAIGKSEDRFSLPDGVKNIGASSFACSTIREINLPDGVINIGAGAFGSCDIWRITMPDSVMKIDNGAFRACSYLTDVNFGNGVTSIGDSAFYDCSRLANINIPESVTSIGEHAFFRTAYYNDTSNWENNVLYIGKYLVDTERRYGSYGDYIDRPEGDYTIKPGTVYMVRNAFNFSELTSVKIPDSITEIPYGAFSNSKSLTSVTILGRAVSIGDLAFWNCSSLMSIDVDSNNPSYCSINGNLYNKKRTKLIRYALGKKDISFDIPRGVTELGDDAFYGCGNLVNITIPDSVTSIGDSAFQDCENLTNVVIPESVTFIGNSAFYNCDSLTSVVIPESVTEIDQNTFSGCRSMKSVTIPGSMTRIDIAAFNNCDSIKDVYYVGSEEKWNQIDIGFHNDGLISATIHYNYGSDKIRNIAVDNNTVHLTLKNNSYQTYDSVRLIVGIYEENGRQMCDMKSVTVKDFSIGYSGDIQLPFDEINPDGKIKIFLWDSSGLLKPITEACKTSVKSVSE